MPSSAPSLPDLAGALATAAELSGVSAAALQALADAAEGVTVAAGASILGDAAGGPGLYLVLQGRLAAVEPAGAGEDTPVRLIGPGEAVDELQTLAGRLRPVLVRAETDALLARVDEKKVDALAAAFPELGAARARLHRRQLLSRLHTVFGAVDRELLDELETAAEWVQLPRGRLLFEQGKAAEALYLVVSGRVQIARYERDGSVRVVGEAGRGETTGEMAFFGGDRREERVQAVRDSILVAFTAAEFEALTRRRPQTLRQVTRTLVERLHRGTPVAAAARGRVTNVAVVPVRPTPRLEELCARLERALAAFGPTLHLTAARLEELTEEPGIAGAWEGAEGEQLLAWLEASEAAHRFVVYQADPTLSTWTRRCIRQADRVLLVADAADDPGLAELERGLLATEGRGTDGHEVLVLVHPDGSRLPSGTRAWLEPRSVEEHFHLRWDGAGDFARLARGLAGRAVGLVLGGGGARGFAHIGILRALAEAGVPVDMVGGTSMGASVAAQHAMGWSADRIPEVNREVWVEMRPHWKITVPVLSMVGSAKAEVCGRMMYGQTEIEDLWIPFFSVSANLSTAEMVVHRTGSLLRAATASASIPGFAVPVLEGNHLLVDGAVLNNVPTDVMRALGCGTVIASEVSVEEDASFCCTRIPTAWEAVRGRFTGTAEGRFPSFLEVAMRASMLASIHREKTALQQADFCLRAPIEPFSLMDFPRLDEIVDTGYQYAREAVRGWSRDGSLLPAAGGAAAGAEPSPEAAAELVGAG